MNYKDIILACNNILDKEPPISDSELENALRELEMIRRPLLEARVEAQIELINKRNQYLHPKDRDLTELDRKLMLDVHTTTELQRFELLSGLEYLIKDRRATLSLLLDI